jgi:hypothetical protein
MVLEELDKGLYEIIPHCEMFVMFYVESCLPVGHIAEIGEEILCCSTENQLLTFYANFRCKIIKHNLDFIEPSQDITKLDWICVVQKIDE